MFTSDFSEALHILSVAFVPALLGIILHEVAHGWVAKLCGDPTAQMMGRLTLNPVPHIDPMGLLVFGLTSLTGFVFGWAKPVPVNPRYFRKPARDMMLVGLAGPATNFLLAVAFGILLWLTVQLVPASMWQTSSLPRFCVESMQAGVVINFGLGWLNLLPIPPLDGSKILAYFLPPRLALRYLSYAKYGFIILLALLFTGILSKVLTPLVLGSSTLVLRALGL